MQQTHLPRPVVENPEEDDGIFPESFEGAPAPLSGGLAEEQITKEEIAPGIVKPEVPAILDATASDVLPEEEPILDREEQRASPISRKREAEEVLYDYEDDEEEPDLGGGIGDIKEEIVPQQYDATPHQPTATVLALPPAPHRGGQYRACPHALWGPPYRWTDALPVLWCGDHQAIVAEAAREGEDRPLVCRRGSLASGGKTEE